MYQNWKERAYCFRHHILLDLLWSNTYSCNIHLVKSQWLERTQDYSKQSWCMYLSRPSNHYFQAHRSVLQSPLIRAASLVVGGGYRTSRSAVEWLALNGHLCHLSQGSGNTAGEKAQRIWESEGGLECCGMLSWGVTWRLYPWILSKTSSPPAQELHKIRPSAFRHGGCTLMRCHTSLRIIGS